MKKEISELIKSLSIDESQLFDMLLKALGHQEKEIVIGASLMLGKLADEKAVPFLLRAFLTNDQEIGSAVAWALGRCRSPSSAPFLAKAVAKGFAVANSCDALGHIKDTSVIPTLLDALISNSEDVRLCSLKALGNLLPFCMDPQREVVLGRLHTLCQDPSRRIRMCAAMVCQKIERTR